MRTGSHTDDALLAVKSVSKKFCRDLKRGMWYGMQDLLGAIVGIQPAIDRLRTKEFWALEDISFELKRGQVLGVVGRNGSGKTTLMRLIAGIYPFEKGSIGLNGKVTSLFAITAGMQSDFSGRENILLKGALFGMSKAEITAKLDDIIAFSELEEFMDAPLGTYSSGMRTKLAFSIAIATDADILIIDEGLAVGDEVFKAKCLKHLEKKAPQLGIIFISHQAKQVEKIATNILVLDKGKVVHASDDVPGGIQFYLDHCRAVPEGFELEPFDIS